MMKMEMMEMSGQVGVEKEEGKEGRRDRLILAGGLTTLIDASVFEMW